MNNTFLKVASGIFVVLIVLALVPWLGDLLKGKGNEATVPTNTSVNLAAFTESSVDRIAMKQKDTDEIVLEKSGEDWKIGADIADKEKVAGLFQAFSKLEIREMVSKNEDNFKKFGVTKDEGIRLAIREKNGKEQVFYAGNPGAIPEEFSFRKDGIKNTYSVRGALRDLLTKDGAYWKKSEESKTETKQTTDEVK